MFKNLAVLAAVLLATQAFANPVTPNYTSFGSLAAATFGGHGISNSDVAITSLGGGKPTLGLSATQRYVNPAVVSDGNGVFHAVTGAYDSSDNLARWNFDYYIGGSSFGYTYKLQADFDPAAGTDLSSYVDLSYLLIFQSQDSLNLGGLLGAASNNFDPNAAGEYGVVLTAYKWGQQVGQSSILIDVSNVPEPASLALVAVALAGLGVAARRRKA